MSPIIKFESDWLKANNNVFDGDRVRFLDTGTQDKDGRWVFNVGVIKKEGDVVVCQKKFSLNKVNFGVLSRLFESENSDDWKDKEAVVKIGTDRNPQTGEDVDTVRFVGPDDKEE